MGKIRVYCKENLKTSTKLIIEGEDFHYLKNVMRLNIGQKLFLFNEVCGEFECSVNVVGKKNIEITIEKQARTPEDEKLNDVELIFPPIRHTRLDFLIEKATELGVATLSPVVTKNTAVKGVNIERLFNIAKEATEQSRRIHIPEIKSMEKLSDKIMKFDFKKRTLIYFDERQNITENTVSALRNFKGKPVSFLIGPEGGFSQEEFDMLKKAGAVSVNLGQLILRAETAGIVAMALYNIGMGD